jgi:hypothetical protein
MPVADAGAGIAWLHSFFLTMLLYCGNIIRTRATGSLTAAIALDLMSIRLAAPSVACNRALVFGALCRTHCRLAIAIRSCMK